MLEPHEAGVFHAVAFGSHGRQENPLGQRRVRSEADLIGPFGNPAHERDDRPVLPAGRQLGLKAGKSVLELMHGESLAQRVEDVVGALTVASESAKLTAKDDRVERHGCDRSSRRERWHDLDADFAAVVDSSCPKLDGGPMSLPDPPDAHHKAQAALRHAGLIGMGHHAGVAQRRAFERVLAGERCPEKQTTLLGEVAPGIEAIGQLVRVPPEGTGEVAVTVFEPGGDISQRPLHFVVVQRQDAGHHS